MVIQTKDTLVEQLTQSANNMNKIRERKAKEKSLQTLQESEPVKPQLNVETRK